MSETFEQAKRLGLLHLQVRAGIGTLGEKSLHAVFKYWLDPDESHHEVRLDGCVADIFDGERVTEIQTRGFGTLRPKLERLLEQYPVTVVHPLPWHKTLTWVQPESGEMTKPRRSPKTGQFWDAAGELYAISGLLGHPRLTVRLVLVDVEEYRMADGWSADGKKGSHRAERIPVALGPELTLHSQEDYACLLPAVLPDAFTTPQLAKAARLSRKKAGHLVNILYKTENIKRTGKQGRAYLYGRLDSGGRL
mgnify:CR=1 FL=1